MSAPFHWPREADAVPYQRFQLSATSQRRLVGVHDDLVRVVTRAIQLTPVDFGVSEGLRDARRQRELVNSGASQTMDSRHLTGHAVDLFAWVDGAVAWDWPLYFKLGDAMRQAAQEAGVPLVWGAAWGRLLNDYRTAGAASDAYVDERRAQGRRPFLDGPHFELQRAEYPA